MDEGDHRRAQQLRPERSRCAAAASRAASAARATGAGGIQLRAPLPPDTEIANYRVQRVLGRGGMGLVYVAEHVHLQRMVALKTISGAYAQSPEFRDRFVRESRMAAQIDPSIVPIYDAGESNGLLYLAMRFVQGEDLEQLIQREAPVAEPAEVLDVVDQVASALDTAHAEGLVHRDVKPANILLEARKSSRSWHTYLADFGLTKHADAQSGLTVTGQVVGTPFYVAPDGQLLASSPPTPTRRGRA